MPTALAIPVFLVSLAVTLGAAAFFARRLDRLGLRLGLPETLLGLLTALAADAPEVSSAIAALVKGEHDVAVGVVVGSNVFNIAAMVGVSAVLVGVRLRREALIVEGFVGLWATIVVTVLLLEGITPAVAIVLLALVFVPYVALLAAGPEGVMALHLRLGRARFLVSVFGEPHRAAEPQPSHGETILRPALMLLPALAIIVLGATGMVTAAVDLGDRWSVPGALVGVLVLAVLTSLPNAYTAIRLGLQRRGSALASDTLNSNSINLVAGIAVPALLVGLASLTALSAFELGWLIAMTLFALLALGQKQGAGRQAGLTLIALYAVFVVVEIAARA
jgi:cation:H+ antiporter